jgi:tetratricopeptide (TPR) repeat protein
VAELVLLGAATPDGGVCRAIARDHLPDLGGAMQAIERARAARPNDERIAERYFYMLMARARWAEARSLLDIMPHTWDWLQKAGDLASESEGETQAIQYYTQAIEHLEAQFDTSVDSFAQSIKSHLLASRAQMYATLGQFSEADADYASAEALVPDDPTLAFWHSFVAVELGDEERALTLCRTALKNAGEGWRANMIQSLEVMRDAGRYRVLVDEVLGDSID